MSYDVRFGVETKMSDRWGEHFAVVHTPEYDSPTYNYYDLFRACMGWDYEHGVWYPMADVLPYIERGIHELSFNREKYRKYEPKNGWGSLDGALKCLRNWQAELGDPYGVTYEWPLETLWFRW